MDRQLIDEETFKGALRTWASGVTILTSVVDDQVHGMTVSAFSSVSVVPPLILVCANQASFTHQVIQVSGVFAVNVLASDQANISTRFAMGDAAHRFDDVPWTAGESGAPLLDGALVSLECRVRSRYNEGTHTIYVGEVNAARFRHANAQNAAAPPSPQSRASEALSPLVYFDGGYRALIHDPALAAR